MIEIQNDSDIVRLITAIEIVVIAYTAKWCAYCDKIKEILECIQLKSDKFIIVNADIDYQKELILTQNIYSVPILYYYKSGNVYLKESGLKSQEHIEKNICSLMNLDTLNLIH